MKYSEEHLRRQQNIRKWFAPARFGLFYHWGLFTGGGDVTRNEPLTYRNTDEFERAVPDPVLVASNMVQTALDCGARYITLTLMHGCDGDFLIYPAKTRISVNQSSKDYAGIFIQTCHEKGIVPILYIHGTPFAHEHLREECRMPQGFTRHLKELIRELHHQFGNLLGGFWLDGFHESSDVPSFIHALSEDYIVIANNSTALEMRSIDFGTTEFVEAPFDPPYCRPSGLRRIAPSNISVPGRDFNEDIPTCCDWWYRGEDAISKDPHAADYLADPFFLLKQMISSLGQRGQWNFSWGIGPKADGTMPECFHSSLDAVAHFMKWGSEAIYNTIGGEGSLINPGFFTGPWSPEGFCSVTRRLDDPRIHYILVTTKPSLVRGKPVNEELYHKALFHTDGIIPENVTDLRTGQKIPYRMAAGISLENICWEDVDRYGVKVFKVEF